MDPTLEAEFSFCTLFSINCILLAQLIILIITNNKLIILIIISFPMTKINEVPLFMIMD